MKDISTHLKLDEDQSALFVQAKAIVEEQLGGTVADESFIKMMLMESVRSVVAEEARRAEFHKRRKVAVNNTSKDDVAAHIAQQNDTLIRHGFDLPKGQ